MVEKTMGCFFESLIPTGKVPPPGSSSTTVATPRVGDIAPESPLHFLLLSLVHSAPTTKIIFMSFGLRVVSVAVVDALSRRPLSHDGKPWPRRGRGRNSEGGAPFSLDLCRAHEVEPFVKIIEY
jgi:hypothetical protein